MKPYVISIFFFMLVFQNIGICQTEADFDLECDVKKVYPAISINEVKLKDVETVSDLNRYFKTSWVKEYESVEIITANNGEVTKSIGQDSVLTAAQKAQLQDVDEQSDIKVNVLYTPENTLANNETKRFSFSCSIDPAHDAKFVGGETELQKYLNERVVKYLPKEAIGQYQLAAIKFTVSPVGEVENAELAWSSEDEGFDKLMLAAVCDMPNWVPAKYASGLETEQAFALRIGDMTSCVVNLLNTNPKPVE